MYVGWASNLRYKKWQLFSKPSKQIAEIIDSVLDNEKRKKNIAIHNLPEAMAETHADMMIKDKASFTQLV